MVRGHHPGAMDFISELELSFFRSALQTSRRGNHKEAANRRKVSFKALKRAVRRQRHPVSSSEAVRLADCGLEWKRHHSSASGCVSGLVV